MTNRIGDEYRAPSEIRKGSPTSIAAVLKPPAPPKGREIVAPVALRDLFTRRPPANDQPISDSGRAHVSGFLALEEMNALLQGPQGLQTYDAMWRSDPDVRRAVRMAANPIVTATWSVEAFGGDEATAQDQKIASDLEWALGLGAQGATSPLRPRFQAHLAQALPATIRWGFCPFEMTWTTAVAPSGKTIVTPSRIGMRLPRTIYRWLLDEDHELEAIEQFLPLRGYVVIPREDLLYYRIEAEGDNYEGVSMLRPCYKPWLIKDKIERLDAIACEREAVGLPVAYPPRAGVTSPAVLADLEVKLQNLRAGELAYLIMPGPKAASTKDQGGWDFEIMGLAGTKGGRDVSKTLEYHRSAIAAAFIEEFMMLGQGGVGARATADVQEGPFNMACESLGHVFEDEINEMLIPRWVELNYGADTSLPTVSMSMAEEPLEDLRDYVAALIAVGVVTPDGILEDFMRQRADLPPADVEVRAQVQAQQQAQRQAATDMANNPLSHAPQPTGGAGDPSDPDSSGGAGMDPTAERSVVVRHAVPGEVPASGAARSPEWTAKLLASIRDKDFPTQLAMLLDTPNRSTGYSGDGTWPTTSGKAGVDGVPTPDTWVQAGNLSPDAWSCPCEKPGCGCASPVSCTFVPSVDMSYSIDANPKRKRRNAGDGTDANAPDAVDPPGGRTL